MKKLSAILTLLLVLLVANGCAATKRDIGLKVVCPIFNIEWKSVAEGTYLQARPQAPAQPEAATAVPK